MKRHLLLLLCTLLSALPMAASDSYELMSRKAAQYAEWGDLRQALGEYAKMRRAEPDSVEPYAAPMVICSVLGEPASVQAILDSALNAGLPARPLLAACRADAVRLAHLDHYENILLLAQADTRTEPTAVPLLLEYYAFRRDGAKTVQYADLLLRSRPNDVRLLTARAMGYIDMQSDAEAMQAFRDVLTADPQNLEALLYLGNYLYARGETAQAVPYLRQARALRPSLRLEALLGQEP